MSSIPSSSQSSLRTKSQFLSSCSKKQLPAHRKKVHSIAWNCDGTRLSSGSMDHTVQTWQFNGERDPTSQELKGHTDGVDQVVWNPKHPDIFCSSGGDRTVRVWDARGTLRIF